MKWHLVLLVAFVLEVAAPCSVQSQVLGEVVDVMVAFEGNAFVNVPDRLGAASRIISNANDALQNSGVPHRYNMIYAHDQPLSFAIAPGTRDTQVLNAMGTQEVSDLRNLHAADLVVLVTEYLERDDGGGGHCGAALAVADAMPRETYRDLGYRMAIRRDCVFSTDPNVQTVPAHELGHLLYLEHQKDADPQRDANTTSPVTYNHPAWLADRATLMVAGPTVCTTGCNPVLNLHSDPEATFPDTSLPRGHSFDRNDKRFISEAFLAVSRYKPVQSPIAVATPTCTYEYTGCVGTKKRYLASWYRNESQPLGRGFAQYSTNNGSTWIDLVNGTQAACSPVVPATSWVIRAFIRTVYGDSAFCYMDILYQPCEDDPPL